MKKKKDYIYLLFFANILYFEFLFRVFASKNIWSYTWIYTILYTGLISSILGTICSSFKEKINKLLVYIIFFILIIWYSGEIIFKNSFHVYFSLQTLLFTDQAVSFIDKILEIIISYTPILLLLIIPFINIVIYQKNINNVPKKLKIRVSYIFLGIIFYFLFLGCVLNDNNFVNSPKDLYFNKNNNALNKETFGVLTSVEIELRNLFFPKINIKYENIEIDKKEETQIIYEPNIINIPFEKLQNEEKDETIKIMHEYFQKDEGTNKNLYTGYFKGKNLILIMAESLNSIAVDENLTPTLYKLSHEGFVFENFYSPVILSTIGGEFQELTGLYPNLSSLSNIWRKGSNSFPFGYGNVFKNLGYSTYAYHNHKYSFQNRDSYLNSLGLSNYLGCGNGLEKKINCEQWPESDIELITATTKDYLTQKKPFFTYYVTVSGHMSYSFKKNDIAQKNKEKVTHLPYSEDILAYLASQIELDKALEELIKQLEENGELNNTVIAVVADHYPYDIPLDHINELANPKKDEIIEINRSPFILWNSELTPKKITKVGGNMDVLPTILNLFGIEYDSRLIMGRDLLSEQEGLVIFDDGSWISDKATFYAKQNKFIQKEEIKEDYIKKINQIVSNRINMSKLILEKDYYKKVLGE